MSNQAPTGEMKFANEKTGVFISHQDALLYYAALHTVINGRHDPISDLQVKQLMALLREADDEAIGTVQVLKSFDECKIAASVVDPVMRT